MGHSLKSNWHEAAAVARDHPHAYLELTGVLGQWGAVDILCEEAGSDRMGFSSVRTCLSTETIRGSDIFCPRT